MEKILIALFCFLAFKYAGLTDLEVLTNKTEDHTILVTLIIVLGIVICFWPPKDNNKNLI